MFCFHCFTSAVDITPEMSRIFRDKYSEELAYPGIFVSQKRPENHHRLVDVL